MGGKGTNQPPQKKGKTGYFARRERKNRKKRKKTDVSKEGGFLRKIYERGEKGRFHWGLSGGLRKKEYQLEEKNINTRKSLMSRVREIGVWKRKSLRGETQKTRKKSKRIEELARGMGKLGRGEEKGKRTNGDSHWEKGEKKIKAKKGGKSKSCAEKRENYPFGGIMTLRQNWAKNEKMKRGKG